MIEELLVVFKRCLQEGVQCECIVNILIVKKSACKSVWDLGQSVELNFRKTSPCN